MNILLSPQVMDGRLILHKYKDTLVINSEEFDFSRLSEGDALPASAIDSKYFFKEITRRNGVLEVTILLPVRWDAPESAMYPPKLVDVSDGKVLDSEEYYEH